MRMLNEFTYCNRLGYLMWAQGEWAPNLETRQGTFAHRRVDKPDRKDVPAPETTDPEAVLHARSVSLSAPNEGLIAKLDLLEVDGNRATPVDYKKGQAPDLPEGAYESERVQLCAQGLILRENGFQCDEGIIYFVASKRRVAIPFDDDLVARTRQLARDFRRISEASSPPAPLVDSPKCPRCSLVGICLPDEINLLADRRPEEANSHDREAGPRKLLPTNTNALPFYVQQQGAVVGKSGERLTVKLKGELLCDTRLLDVSQVCLFGNVMITAPALSELVRRGAAVCHFSYGGWFNAMTTGLAHKNIDLRMQQFAVGTDREASLAIARQMVAGKIRNGRTLLRRALRERRLGDRHHPALVALDDYRRKAEQVGDADSLLGLEGMAAKTYFSEYFQLLPAWTRGAVDGRNRRPPTDPANAILSFLYSLLAKDMHIVVQSVGFDPMLGLYHRPRYGRPSLALDLAEEFRHLIADSAALTLFNNGELSESSFIRKAGAVALTDAGRRAVISAYERRLATEATHPIFGYRIEYRRILEVQCRLLARTIQKEISEYPAFTTR